MAIASDYEQRRFDCVVTPTDHRRPYDEKNDHVVGVYDEAWSHYTKESATSSAPVNRNDWTPIYTRRVTGHGKAHTGFHVIHNYKRDALGKPKTQFIIANDI
jgi:hypothetical protein